MATVFSCPGKKGDALLQYPVAMQWSKMTGKRFTLWLDENSLKPLERLFGSQECVEAVVFKPGITSYHLGGQPWDFGLQTQDFKDNTIYHLGFRQPPERQITLQTAMAVPFHLDTAKLAQEPSLSIVGPLTANRVVLHGTFQSHHTGVPKFWTFIRDIRKDLEERFDEITFIGTQAETARALELYPQWNAFDDKGDFYDTARLVAGSKLVIGSGSVGVVLAGALKVPSIRVHDPIGEWPKVIWSNLGPGQVNETEQDLRRLWPELRKQYDRSGAEVVDAVTQT